jgi:putative transposase
VTPTARRVAVQVMVQEHRLSRVRACQAVGLPRSALYKPTPDRAARDAPVIEAINEVVEKRPRWGFWKCFERLRADGRCWNHKRVYRVYCTMRLNIKRKARRRVITRVRQPLLTSQELNRVWALDFMRDTLYDGRPFRTLNVIDEGNREALRIECGTSIPSTRVVRVMDQLVEVYGKPRAVRLDNGPELTADAFVEWARKNNIELLFIQPGKPNQNAFVERFNRSFREEVLNAWLFGTVTEAQQAADDWLTDYNEFRPHESLGNVPPAVFKPRVFNQEVSTSELST